MVADSQKIKLNLYEIEQNHQYKQVDEVKLLMKILKIKMAAEVKPDLI